MSMTASWAVVADVSPWRLVGTEATCPASASDLRLALQPAALQSAVVRVPSFVLASAAGRSAFTMIVCLNGRFVPEDRAVVSVFDRSFLYGDGLFESILVHGGRLVWWTQHLERL